jgi:hypothetical protein
VTFFQLTRCVERKFAGAAHKVLSTFAPFCIFYIAVFVFHESYAFAVVGFAAGRAQDASKGVRNQQPL